TTGVNRISYWKNGRVITFDLDPAEFGLPRATIADYVGGTPAENAAITRAILSGEDTGPCRDVVLLNAAAALSLKRGHIAAGLAEARESIDSGKALATLEAWIDKTNSYK
ncbi:MAG: anthranilate phosphoribosyltransferase, partial [Aquificales bacterium]|nr:anthranilate phosphoribosyltransferase [Aquificales bacterium]